MNNSAQIPRGVRIVEKKKLIRVIPTRRRQPLLDHCDPPVPAAVSVQEDRFSDEAIRKQTILNKLKSCRRLRITTPPYNHWGWGKVIIAVEGNVLLWFPDVHCHLCFLREEVEVSYR